MPRSAPITRTHTPPGSEVAVLQNGAVSVAVVVLVYVRGSVVVCHSSTVVVKVDNVVVTVTPTNVGT